MNSVNGVWCLQRLKIRYSETGGSSLGARFFIRHLLPSFQDENPAIHISTEHSQWEHPLVRANWISGEQAITEVRKWSAQQIQELCMLYRNSEGANMYLRHGGPRVWTEKRSVQGLWQPSMELQRKSLAFFLDRARAKAKELKYTGTSLRLSQAQVIKGDGRWGALEANPILGVQRMRAISKNPFLTDKQEAQRVEKNLYEARQSVE